MNQQKPVIGISCGDLNGIGIELIIKTFSDNRILEQCTPVIFASNKAINFYKSRCRNFTLATKAPKNSAGLIINRSTYLTAGRKKWKLTPGS